jgi:hypothetical protein
MRRREFIKLLGTGVATALPLPSCAQQPGGMQCVGMLETVSTVLKHDDFGAFRQAL